MRYKLLKDTIKDDGVKNYTVPKGTLFKNGGYGKYISDDESLWSFNVEFVENTPEWFEKVEDDINCIFDVERIQQRLNYLNDLQDAFNAARETTGKVIGRGEYNDGDCGDLYDNKYKNFQDYMSSKNGQN